MAVPLVGVVTGVVDAADAATGPLDVPLTTAYAAPAKPTTAKMMSAIFTAHYSNVL